MLWIGQVIGHVTDISHLAQTIKIGVGVGHLTRTHWIGPESEIWLVYFGTMVGVVH